MPSGSLRHPSPSTSMRWHAYTLTTFRYPARILPAADVRLQSLWQRLKTPEHSGMGMRWIWTHGNMTRRPRPSLTRLQPLLPVRHIVSSPTGTGFFLRHLVLPHLSPTLTLARIVGAITCPRGRIAGHSLALLCRIQAHLLKALERPGCARTNVPEKACGPRGDGLNKSVRRNDAPLVVALLRSEATPAESDAE